MMRPIRRIQQAAILAVPATLTVAVAVATRQLLAPSQTPILAPIASLLALATAIATICGIDRAGRRFLPLRWLSGLADVFQDQVPRRLAHALRSANARRSEAELASTDAGDVAATESMLKLVQELTNHDRLTRGHSERVRAVAVMLAHELNIAGDERDRLEWAVLLHDVGKVEVPPSVLNKPGAPDVTEWELLRQHPADGVVKVGPVRVWLADSAHAIDQHHERFDGSGYPLGLRGDEIAQPARIVAVADAFEVMTANRSYKRSLPIAAARRELIACSGTHFDPVVVRAFVSLSVARLSPSLAPAAWLVSLSL